MPGQFDGQIRTKSATAAREIKASAHYAYILNGITLDGTKFAAGELVLEGQCLCKDNATGKYEKYADSAGAFPAGKSDPVILDTSVKFVAKDNGTNPDVVVGAVLVHGAVHRGMLKGNTTAFEAKVGGAIRFV
jgi:hypothetical protein